MAKFLFQRPVLANQFCEALAGRGILNARSGLFLAAPRFVGKSTFLKNDLMPEIVARGWLPIYIDLWSDLNIDPGILIAETINATINQLESLTGHKVKNSTEGSKSHRGIDVLDMNKSGISDNITLPNLLDRLNTVTNKPIVLIIDEAQHALNTDSGLHVMYALKAARDYLNRSGDHPKLMLVFVGSQRGKLAQLVKKDQAFFGVNITAFPLLGYEFVNEFTKRANANLAQGNQLVTVEVLEAFELVGHRPEMLHNLIGQIAIAGDAGNLSLILQDKAIRFHEQIWDEMEGAFATLNPLHRAVLQVMIANRGVSFSLYAEASITEYQRITGENAISTISVQNAIKTLCEKGLVWKPSRGHYMLEDDGFAEWYIKTYMN